MYELDPDVVRWGLHLIDVCSLTNDGSQRTITCYEKDISMTESVEEGFNDPAYSIMENDEVIAQALQEELSRLAVVEASGSASSGEQYQKASVLAQDWVGPSERHLNSEYQSNQEEEGNNDAVLVEPEESSMENEDQNVLPEIEDESVLDDELGKRLNQMVPVPFRSLSDQIYRSPDHHKFVREQVVNQLKSRAELYEDYVPMAYSDYLKKMSKNGEWGDHITLQAAADWFGIKIFVITSFKDTCYIEILPQSQKSNRTIFLSFWAEVHYNSIYPLGELPSVEEKKKKRWWW
ncbi:OTU domain-containing protein DDB_G0284757 isoform X2 [Sesamum indicum]|uniref:OTU domain-containing protein DDB_G0284757 isoform X2 n=1 Tax=Sesamum indicum TaxID=4182 RepID=A0A6I9TH14_SESIN|nr:OTU domain-containing protein DDB_G0284757 isoform X2 [Sesamum indicum]